MTFPIRPSTSMESLLSRNESSPGTAASPVQKTQTRLTIKELGMKLNLSVITDRSALISFKEQRPMQPPLETPKGTPGYQATMRLVERTCHAMGRNYYDFEEEFELIGTAKSTLRELQKETQKLQQALQAPSKIPSKKSHAPIFHSNQKEVL